MPLLPIDRIRTDGGTQSRVQLDWIATGEYAVAMQDGAVFPPVVVTGVYRQPQLEAEQQSLLHSEQPT